MPESLRTRFYRWGFNFFPAYRGTGAWITYIAADWREVRLRLPLSWQTRNYVGVIYGGSIYASVDPIYMIMLIKNLGSGYIVWDKAATVRFRKPGVSTLYACFRLEQGELEGIRAGLRTQHSVDRLYTVDLADTVGLVRATVEKTIYIARNEEAK